MIDPTSGDLVAAGSLVSIGGIGAFVARFTTAGALNPINDEYLVAGSVGSNLLTGEISSMGVLDTGFGTSGVDSVSGLTAIYGLAVQSDGSILLAGPAPTGLAVMRLFASGQADTSYGSNGSFTWAFTAPASAFFKKLLVDGNDEAVLVANTSTGGPTPTRAGEIIRVTTAGAQDSTFANGVLSLSSGTTIDDAALASSGEMILAISGFSGAQSTEIK